VGEFWLPHDHVLVAVYWPGVNAGPPFCGSSTTFTVRTVPGVSVPELTGAQVSPCPGAGYT